MPSTRASSDSVSADAAVAPRSAAFAAHRPGPSSHAARAPIVAALALLCVHGALLAASIPDYRVTIDSAYHVSLARYYGVHGQAWWDHINFGPRGRPNLQGPLMHAAVAVVGRALGGRGSDYVVANAIMGVAQWGAAMGTAAWFAFELGGEWAMLLTAALLSGAACTSAAFAVGIPSGWMFIFTGWAIWFFVRGRNWLSAAFTTAAIYAHLGGYATAPLGIIIAALMTRRWRALVEVGIITALLTAPYTVHVLRYVNWLSGVHSHSALLFDPLLDIVALAGALRLFKHPRRNVFMVAWLCAPAAWAFQDTSRFILQSGMAGSVAGSLLLVDLLQCFKRERIGLYASAIAAVATFFPLGAPSLAAEISWDAGFRYPRAIQWHRAQALARIIEKNGLTSTLIADYNPALCPAMAVFAPITCEKGHWIEVEPPSDPADQLSAAYKTYVLPLPPDDPVLLEAVRRGLIELYGGNGDSSVARLNMRGDFAASSTYADEVIARNSRWLAANAINNSLTLHNWRRLLSAAQLRAYQQHLAQQRTAAGDVELACLIKAYALEREDGAEAVAARAMRRDARGVGVIASFLGDGLALDFISPARFLQLRRGFLMLAQAAQSEPAARRQSAVTQALDALIATVLVTRGDSFAARPSGDWLPWLAGGNNRGAAVQLPKPAAAP